MLEEILPRGERVSKELKVEDLPKPIDFKVLFGNDNPVELEIGIGKGRFMAAAAQTFPDRNYLGVEYARKYLRMADDRIQKRPINNAFVVNTEAMGFMADHIASATLAAVHLYFPDPWPKKRHNKRRIFTQAFIEEVHRMLVPGGKLLIATDHADYWEWMQDVLKVQTLLEETEDRPKPPREGEALTNFEMKYVAEGRPIYSTGYRKP